MNKIYLVIFASALVMAHAEIAHSALSAKEIMQKNEDARKLGDITSDAEMKTGGGGDKDKSKKFTWWRKLKADQVRYDTLTRFHLPAEIRNEGILFLEHDKNENEVLLYLPNFKKIRRVEAQQQSGSFMGSAFSYSDISTPHVDDYKYVLLKEESCPSTESASLKCWVIESTPLTDSVRDRTQYSKAVNWVRQDNFMAVQTENYDLSAQLIKRMKASKIEQVDKTRGKWMALLLRMENLKNSKFTELEFRNLKVNAGISEALFTQQNLSRVP